MSQPTFSRSGFVYAALLAACSTLAACTGDDNTLPAPVPDSGASTDSGAKDSSATDGTVPEAGGDAEADAGDAGTDTGTNEDAGDASETGTDDAGEDGGDAADLDAPADG